MKRLVLWLLLLPFFCFSQEKIFCGKIETGSMLQDVLVINLTKEIETRTDGFGKFSIKANTGDLLIFSSEFVHRKRFLVEKEHFNQENKILLETQDIEIQTVEIQDYNINSVSLGLVEKGNVLPTPAERKLFTASGGGKVRSIDNLINTITGKKRMLKSILEMEREDKRVAYISGIFDDDYFSEALKIKPENIDEFKLFALYEILKNIKKEEKTQYLKNLSDKELDFLLISLAEEYRVIKYEAEK